MLELPATSIWALARRFVSTPPTRFSQAQPNAEGEELHDLPAVECEVRREVLPEDADSGLQISLDRVQHSRGRRGRVPARKSTPRRPR